MRLKRGIAFILICALLSLGLCASAEGLVLPATLRVIEAEAFEGWSGANEVTLPEGIQEIRSRAFANSSVKSINLPQTLTSIADDAFEGTALETVSAKAGSYAYKWAVRKGYIAASGTIRIKIALKPAKPRLGDTLRWTVTAAGGTGDYVYSYALYRDGAFIGSSGDTADNYIEYDCKDAGTYQIACVVTDGQATDSATGKAVKVAEAEALSAEIQCGAKSAKVGDSVVWTVEASGGSGRYGYTYGVFRDGELVTSTEESDETQLTYKVKQAGVYTVTCRVTDGTDEISVKSGEIRAEEKLTAAIRCSAKEVEVGEKLKWTVTASGGSGQYEYYYEIFRDGKRVAYTKDEASDTLTVKAAKTGEYYATCKVTSGEETAEATSEVILVRESGLVITGLDVDASQFMTTETHTWKVGVSGGKAPYVYSYTLKRDKAQVDHQGFASGDTYSYTFFKEGAYTLTVQVRDAENKTATESFDFTVALGNEHITGVVRVYVDCDNSGQIKRSSSNTGHYELQLNNESGTIAFDNHELTDPVFAYGKGANSAGVVKVFDSDGISRTSGSSFMLYTFTFTTTAEQVDALLNTELKDVFLDPATEYYDGSAYNYSVVDSGFRTYQIKSANCFTALARWCSLLGYGRLSTIASSASGYTDYIGWKLYEKYGSDWQWQYIDTYYL